MNQRDTPNISSVQKPMTIQELPLIPWLVASCFLTSFIGGMYMESYFQSIDIPLGWEAMTIHLGFVFYSAVSFLAIMLGGSVVYRGYKKKRWSQNENDIFYGSVLISIIFILIGLQDYLLFHKAYLWSDLVLLIEGGVILVLMVYLFRIFIHERGVLKHQRELEER